jgi:hypothetical protein
MLPPNARACPECGADEATGWSDRAQAQRLGLPDDDFDYDEFVKGEFGEGQRRTADRLKPPGMRWVWWVVAVLLLLGFVLSFVFHG